MSKVRQRDMLQGEMRCVGRGEVYGFVALHLTFHLLNRSPSGKYCRGYLYSSISLDS